MWPEIIISFMMLVLLKLESFALLECKFEIGSIACVFKDGELVHAGRDRWVQYQTVTLPIVFKIVFTEPVYGCL